MLDFIGRMFFGLLNFLKTGFGQITVLLLAPVVGFFGMILKLIVTVETYFNGLIDQATVAAGDGAATLGAGTMMGIGNHFVPLDTMFGYCTILVSLWLVSLVYRAIKSFVPTLS